MNTGVYHRESRFIIEKDLTQCYVYIDAYPDAPFFLQGWHHKTFPASMSVVDIINTWKDDDPMMWPNAAPSHEPRQPKHYED
jgi:hypothetical protein